MAFIIYPEAFTYNQNELKFLATSWSTQALDEMTSFFGGKTDNKLADQNHKMVDGPVLEVAAHSYEGAPTVKSNGEHAVFSRSYIYLTRDV